MPVAFINGVRDRGSGTRGQKPEVGSMGSDKKISRANLTGESSDPLHQPNWKRIKFSKCPFK